MPKISVSTVCIEANRFGCAVDTDMLAWLQGRTPAVDTDVLAWLEERTPALEPPVFMATSWLSGINLYDMS